MSIAQFDSLKLSTNVSLKTVWSDNSKIFFYFWALFQLFTGLEDIANHSITFQISHNNQQQVAGTPPK